MIEFTRCPVINGKAFETLEEAQQYGLEHLFVGSVDAVPWTATMIANRLIEHSKEVIAILSVKQVGRPRNAPGQRKPRKAKTPEAPKEGGLLSKSILHPATLVAKNFAITGQS